MEDVAHRGRTPEGRERSWSLAEAYRLIARCTGGRTHVLVLEVAGGERVLPVFSASTEAQMFVWLGGLESFPGDAWYPRETATGELLSMLIGPRRSVSRVALDPSPEIMSPGDADEIELACLSRKEFVDRLLSARHGESLNS